MLFGSAFFIFGSGDVDITFRSVTLKVIDAETEQPLAGISVKVVNTTFTPKRHNFFGYTIEQTDINTYRLYEYETDANGLVEIPQYGYKLPANNFLRYQEILINIDTIDVSKKKGGGIFDAVILYSKEGDLFYRPEANYKAARIVSYPYPYDPELHYQMEETKPYYVKIVNGHEVPPFTKQEFKIEPRSFFIDHEEFVIRLERFTGE